MVNSLMLPHSRNNPIFYFKLSKQRYETCFYFRYVNEKVTFNFSIKVHLDVNNTLDWQSTYNFQLM